MKIKFVLGFALLFGIACSKSSNTIIEPPLEEFLSNATIVYKIENGIDQNLTSLDIYTVPNSNTLKPVVIWIHGGGWTVGDKLNQMTTKVPFFNNLNYVFVSVNYRLSPNPFELSNSNRIKHPDHIIDVADATKWIYDNIELYGGDKANIAILGHSAGAHLVALMGTKQSLLTERSINPNHIKGIGSFDTRGYDIPKVIAIETDADLWINAFSNSEIAQVDASPFHQLDNSSIITKHWLFTERGTVVRKEILTDFSTKIEERNSVVTKIDMNTYTHEEVNQLVGNITNRVMTDPIIIFLNNCFQ